MIRILTVFLVCAPPVLGQHSDSLAENRLLQPGDRTRPVPLVARPVVYAERVDAGVVFPGPIDEALVDVEAWLREPIPAEQVSLRRAGFRRPYPGTVWREPITLPDEDALRGDEERLAPTIRGMQGVWRIQRMVLDGRELTPEAFSGLKYLVQGRVIAQSHTSEIWAGAVPTVDPTPVFVAPVVGGALGLIAGPGGAPVAVRAEASPLPVIRSGLPQPAVVIRSGDLGRLGPAGEARPAGGVQRNDPTEEEGVRMNMLYRGEGRATVYWWNRYGEPLDPHMDSNRPSFRVVFPAMGQLELTPEALKLRVRGVGLRTLLPTRFHQPLGVMREVELEMVRDEQVTPVPKRNIIVPPPAGDFTIRPG